jgi:two-component system cell cycle sensor histidine kinase/response regulator CckA
VITTDTRGAIVIINKIAEELTGWTQHEALGKPLAEVFNIINETTRKPCENPVEKVLSSGDSIELANHTVLISKDGVERIIADSGAPIKDAGNKILGVVLVFRDVTEKQKLLDSAQRADKLNAIGLLAGGIAHDFNNLLCGIFGFIDLAKESCSPGSKTAEYLEKSLKTFSRATGLTHQLLTFAKGGHPIRKTGSLALLLEESTQFALSGSSVAASYSIAKDLWLCDFDENQFGQIIDNIVINAVQAMPFGGKLTVSAENSDVLPGTKPLVKQGKHVHISFADTGVGIPPTILPRIFDPFFTTKQKGNGLGLATVYSIIKKHDGEITVESEPGKGTTFHLYMPVSDKTAAPRPAGKALVHQGSGRILIMDDEDCIREVAGDMLTSMGYTIEYAMHGDEALKKIKSAVQTKNRFLAAILDLTIPGGKGGKEIIEQLRKTDRELLVFVSSGYSEDPVIANPADYGFTDRITKPFRKTELAETLGRYGKS